VPDLHAQLLAELDDRYADILGEQRLGRSLVEALRAVVEMHAPIRHVITGVGVVVGCRTCFDSAWPCSTIQVIARELGVDGG